MLGSTSEMNSKTSKYTEIFNSLPDSVQKVIKSLIEQVGPQKIILFGSRARGDHRENSDFDIAVMGRKNSEREWNEALTMIEETPITLHPIDIVEFEKLSDEYQSNIREEGKILYGSVD